MDHTGNVASKEYVAQPDRQKVLYLLAYTLYWFWTDKRAAVQKHYRAQHTLHANVQ